MGGIIGVPVLAFFLGVAVCIVKIVAGGKRRAEQRADAAVERSQQAEELAEVEALQRQLAEARMGRCRRRSSRTSCSIPCPRCVS